MPSWHAAEDLRAGQTLFVWAAGGRTLWGGGGLALESSLAGVGLLRFQVPNTFAKVLHPGHASSCDGLWRLPGLLSDSEASRIIVGSMHLGMAPMAVDDFAGTRRYQRLVVRDEVLAQELWLRAKPLVEEALAEQSKRPLGFACVQGDWELEGLNSCFRVNSYGPEGFLKPHRDAPFSPDVNVRSLCTLLIPLSSAGRTRFFHPVQPKMDYRGMTLKEELDARGGLAAGFHASDIFLSVGSGLLFGQSLLHEGIPADADHHKALLRTDAPWALASFRLK